MITCILGQADTGFSAKGGSVDMTKLAIGRGSGTFGVGSDFLFKQDFRSTFQTFSEETN